MTNNITAVNSLSPGHWPAMVGLNHYSMQLRVDEIILDYLMFAATHTLIENAKSALIDDQRFKNEILVDVSLEMVDCKLLSDPPFALSLLIAFSLSVAFITLFRALHPDHHCNIHVQFRLRLLKYVALLESRGSCVHLYPQGPHLQDAQDDKDVTASISNHEDAPFITPSSRSIDNNDEQLNCKASVGPLSQRKLLASSSLLLDTLPHFMALSAAQLMLQGSHITEIWMKLAAGYMTHAVMEQYFARGEHGLQIIRRAFAWGFDEQSAAEEGSDECQINAMFFDEDNDMQVEGWEKTRNDHIKAVCKSGSL